MRRSISFAALLTLTLVTITASLTSCKSRQTLKSDLSDDFNVASADPAVQELLARMDPPFELGNNVYLPPNPNFYYQNQEFIDGQIKNKFWSQFKFIDASAKQKHDYVVGLNFVLKTASGAQKKLPTLYYTVLAEEAPDLARNLLAMLKAGYFDKKPFALYQAAVPFVGSADAEDLYVLRAQNLLIRDYLTPGKGVQQGDLIMAVQSIGESDAGTTLATKLFVNNLVRIVEWPLYHRPARVAQLLGVEKTSGDKPTYSLPSANAHIKELMDAFAQERPVTIDSHVIRKVSKPYRIGYGSALSQIDGVKKPTKKYDCSAPTRLVDTRERLYFWGDACPKQTVCLNQGMLVMNAEKTASEIAWVCARESALFDCTGGVSATSMKIPESCLASTPMLPGGSPQAAQPTGPCASPNRAVASTRDLQRYGEECPQQVVCMNRKMMVQCGEGSQIGWDCLHEGLAYQCCGGLSATADKVPDACMRNKQQNPWSQD